MARKPKPEADDHADHVCATPPSRISPPFDPPWPSSPAPLLPPRSAAEQAADDADEVPTS